MKTFRFALLVGSVLLLSAVAFAQSSSDAVSLRGAISVDKVKQGGAAQGALVADIKSGFHVNSNHPSEQFLIATAFKLDKADGLTTGIVTYPRASLKKFGFSPKPLSVFEGRVIMRFAITAQAGASVGVHTLHGTLKVQACNEEACFPPKSIPVDIPVEIAPASAQVKSANGDIFKSQARKP